MDNIFFKLVRTLVVTENKPLMNKSFSVIVFEVSKISPKCLENFSNPDFLWSIELTLTQKRSELLTDLSISEPKERVPIFDVLKGLNLSKINKIKDSKSLINLINDSYRKRGFKSRIAPHSETDIKEEIKKIKLISNGFENLKLISYYDIAIRILAYSDRYRVMPKEQINNELGFLSEIRNKELEIFYKPDEIKGLLRTALEKTGHPKMSLEYKSIPELIEILYYKYIAARGTLDGIRLKSQQIINKKDILDGITRVLVFDELEQNKNVAETE